MDGKMKIAKRENLLVESLTWNPQKDGRPILEHISCLFEKGNIYGIIGPNGSGKTSLVKNILRFIQAEEGHIMLDGINLMNYKRKHLAKKMALVPQNTAIESPFCVYDIVMMGRIPYQKRFADASKLDFEIVEQAMRLTDCYELKDKNVATLSGGEAQRVVTARAIAQDTQWLILDEPTSSLDVKHQIDLMESLVKLNRQKENTIIAVLHDINMAAVYCNRMIIMKNGRIHSNGKTEEVLTKENLMDVYGVDFEILENLRTGKNYYIPYYQTK